MPDPSRSVVHLDGQDWSVVGFIARDPLMVELRNTNGQLRTLTHAELTYRTGVSDVTTDPAESDDQDSAGGAVVEYLTKEDRKTVRLLAAHIEELHGGEGPFGTPRRPEYDVQRPLQARREAKIAELRRLGLQIGMSTLREKERRYFKAGVDGLIDRRKTRVRNPGERADPIVQQVLFSCMAAVDERSSATTRRNTILRARQLLARKHPETTIPSMPVLYRMYEMLAHHFTLESGGPRKGARPPFTRTWSPAHNGRLELDTTTLDVKVALGTDRIEKRCEIALAVSTLDFGIAAWAIGPTNTSFDAAALVGRAMTPEPMRPNWPESFRLRQELAGDVGWEDLGIAIQQIAARPIYDVTTIVVDNGKIYVSDALWRLCRAREIHIEICRPGTPTDKGAVEAMMRHVNTAFTSWFDGYVGSNTMRRHPDVDGRPAVPIEHLEELFARWVIQVHQRTPTASNLFAT